MNFAYIRNKFAAFALAVAFALVGMAALTVNSAPAFGETECPKGMKRPDYDWRSPCLSSPALGKGEDAPRLAVNTVAVNGAREYPIESAEVRHNPMTVRYALHNASHNMPRLRYRIYGQHSGGGWSQEWEFRVILTESAYPSAISAALSDCEAEREDIEAKNAHATFADLLGRESEARARIAELEALCADLLEQAGALAAKYDFTY